MTDGIEAALGQANFAANRRHVHIASSPVVLGQGEAPFTGIDLPGFGDRVTEHRAADHATPPSSVCRSRRKG